MHIGLATLMTIVVAALLGWRWPPKFGDGGPLLFGWATVPFEDPPPPRDPASAPETP